VRSPSGPAAPTRRWTLAALLVCASPAAGQIDPSSGWRTLHTPHFRVHFRPAARAAALVETQEAERAYALLGSELPRPRGIIDVVLSDDADAANGAARSFPSNRIYIYLAPPAGDPELASYDRWLRFATVHELTHIFHLDQARSFWGVLQHVFGRAPGLFPNEYQPSWVIEGLATYYESKFTNAGRVNGSFHTQLLASEAAADRARSPWNALLFTRWPAGKAPYANGSRFFQYLADSLGDSVIPRFAHATAGQLIPFRVGRPLARIAPAVSLADAWPRGTRPPGDSGPRDSVEKVVLDRGLWTVPVPRISPDGRFVAYVRDDGKGEPQLRVVTLEGWREVRQRSLNGDVSYDWVGDTIVVSQADFTSRWRVGNDLYHWLPDGRWERLTHGARLRDPRGGAGRLSSIELVPGGNRPTLIAQDSVRDRSADWGEVVPSPDGRWVAATRNAEGHWTLVRWPAGAPGELDVLLASRNVLSDPVWADDGELLFVSEQSGYPQVYRWREHGDPVALTAEPFGARAPAPIADSALLYAALGASGWEVRRARRDPAPPVRPLRAPLPLDSAPPVPTRETGYAILPSLAPRFWLPVGVDQGDAGSFVGALTAGTDAVGRYAYATDLLVSTAPFRVIGAFDGVSYLLGNPSLDLWLSSNWSPIYSGADGDLSENDLDAALGATFLNSYWRGGTSIRLAAEYEGTHYAGSLATVPPTICGGCTNQDLFGGSVALLLSSVVSSPLAVSPEDGFRAALLYRRREEQGTTRWSNEVRASLVGYLHLPGLGGFAHHVVAARVAAGVLDGTLPQRYGVGGVATGGLSLGYGQTLGIARLFPVRGYGASELRGRRAFTTSLEYRIPLALIGQSFGHLPVGADKLSLSLFGDTGDAWDRGATPQPTRLASVGAELVGDLTIVYDAPLRLRLGVAAPLTAPPSGAPRQPQAYVAVGFTF
jgi:hypothetical protein